MRQVPDYYYRQSAVVPVRSREGRLEVLLITSRKRKRWVIPKGVKEPELSGPESAAKEALEEAGIEGDVPDSVLGTYTYDKWGGECTVDVYLMRVKTVHAEWLEQHRGREWVDVDTAAARLDEPALKVIVLSLRGVA
jgi:phosphohistidine phosphatase